MRDLIGSGTRGRPLRMVYGGRPYNTTSAGSRRICSRINVSEYTFAVGAHTQIFITSLKLVDRQSSSVYINPPANLPFSCLTARLGGESLVRCSGDGKERLADAIA